MKQLLFILTVIMLTGCGHHRDGTSVWSDGLFIVPLLPIVGSIYFFVTAFQSSKSGSTINPVFGGGEGGNIPVYKLARFWFGVALLVAAAGIIFWVNMEK